MAVTTVDNASENVIWFSNMGYPGVGILRVTKVYHDFICTDRSTPFPIGSNQIFS